jgi:vacuolar-type H+-ATPase subunit E/Vma4
MIGVRRMNDIIYKIALGYEHEELASIYAVNNKYLVEYQYKIKHLEQQNKELKELVKELYFAWEIGEDIVTSMKKAKQLITESYQFKADGKTLDI